MIEGKLYKMIEHCLKMECAGCRKLIPTHLFFDHLTHNSNCCNENRDELTNRSQNLISQLTKSNDGLNGLRYNNTLCQANTAS